LTAKYSYNIWNENELLPHTAQDLTTVKHVIFRSS